MQTPPIRKERVGGRCLRGERLIGQVARPLENDNFVGALRCKGMTAPYVIDGAMKGKTFLFMWTPFALTLGVTTRGHGHPTKAQACQVIERVARSLSPQYSPI